MLFEGWEFARACLLAFDNIFTEVNEVGKLSSIFEMFHVPFAISTNKLQ